MKQGLLLILSFFVFASGYSCKSISVPKNELIGKSKMNEPQDAVLFSEVRRLNRDIQLGEYLIIKDFEQTVKLYGKLADKSFSRSEPIPALEENEFFVLVKPKMKKQLFGDIEVTKMERKGAVLNLYYKETGNEEYLVNKQKNPIVILRVKGKIPTSIKLINLNK